MTVFLNGERVECGAARTIAELITQQLVSPATALVERNGTALRRRDWPNELLEEGDRIEILQLAAGG